MADFEGIKFFEESVCLFRDGASAVATSNSSNAKVVLTNDRRLKWESVGSDDTTTESLDITFPAASTISRLYLAGNNFKEYEVRYDDSGTFKFILPTTVVDGVTEADELLTNNTIADLSNWSIVTGTYALDSDVPADILPNSILWQNAANFGALRQLSPTFTTETGKTYRVVVYLKGTAGSDMEVWLRNGDDSGNIVSSTFQITAEWQKYEFLFTETAGGSGAFFSLVAREATPIANVYMSYPSVKEYAYEAIDTIYWEFADITVDNLRISCTKTQTADDEKQLVSALAMTEIGQFNLFPDVKGVKASRNEDKKKVLSEKYLVQKNFKTREFSLGFEKHPNQYNLDLKDELFNREFPFYVWLCAGKYGETYFKPQVEPFRLEDLITMQTTNDSGNQYGNNYYKGGINSNLKLVEVVG